MSYRTTEDDIRSWVRAHVWTGEYDAEEVFIIIGEQLGKGDHFDPAWIREVIEAEVAAKREVEKSWPEVTDCDRLDRVFEHLERQGVIALQIAGYTQSDGLEMVEDEYQIRGDDNGPSYAGHCFFTEQDQERALDGNGMCIGFGHLLGDDAAGIAVGNMLRAALEQEGFTVEWDGTIQKRLFVKGFHWQRRGP
jgi:hypothetical protein